MNISTLAIRDSQDMRVWEDDITPSKIKNQLLPANKIGALIHPTSSATAVLGMTNVNYIYRIHALTTTF